MNRAIIDDSRLPITELALIYKGDPTPLGFTLITQSRAGVKAELTRNVKGKYLLLCYKRGEGLPIISMTIVYKSQGESAPPGFETIYKTFKGESANLRSGSSIIPGQVPNFCIFIDLHRVH